MRLILCTRCVLDAISGIIRLITPVTPSPLEPRNYISYRACSVRIGGIRWNLRASLRNHTKMGFNGPSIERF
ncbi:uncharacterized protein V6R79_003738 [Siganus canaliculatus]